VSPGSIRGCHRTPRPCGDSGEQADFFTQQSNNPVIDQSASSARLGLRINGFSGLPIEEPILWLGVTWATVIIYELISTLLFMDWAGEGEGVGALRH
jgi:hypothetical protein